VSTLANRDTCPRPTTRTRRALPSTARPAQLPHICHSSARAAAEARTTRRLQNVSLGRGLFRLFRWIDEFCTFFDTLKKVRLMMASLVPPYSLHTGY
jgi:hypothetical protein